MQREQLLWRNRGQLPSLFDSHLSTLFAYAERDPWELRQPLLGECATLSLSEREFDVVIPLRHIAQKWEVDAGEAIDHSMRRRAINSPAVFLILFWPNSLFLFFLRAFSFQGIARFLDISQTDLLRNLRFSSVFMADDKFVFPTKTLLLCLGFSV
jgi:hypothetical protein